MKYRYEYLGDTFDNKENVFKNVKVQSLHKDVKLDDLIIDFSKTAKEVQEEIKKQKLQDYNKKIEDITNKKINNNYKTENKTYENNSNVLTSEEKSRFCLAYNKKLIEKEKNHIQGLNSKEEIIKYLDSINKHDLLDKIAVYFK